MATPGYIFGGNTGETPESLARKRQIAEALIQSGAGTIPKTIGEGIASVGQALSGRMGVNNVARQEAAGQQSAQQRIAEVLAQTGNGGNGGTGGTGPDFSSVADLVSNPWLSPGQRSVAEAMLNQQMPKVTDDISEFQYGLQNPQFNDWMLNNRRAGATNVNVGQGETEYDKTLGKGLGEEFLTLQAESRKADDTLTSLSVMEQAMADPNFYSGTAANAVLSYKRAIASLGGDPDAAASMENFNAQAKKAALDNMGGSLGAGFSNADRDFVVEQVPTLGNTPEGNRRLIEINKKIQQRKIQISQLAREYAAGNKNRIDQGFYDVLSRWSEANPLFPEQPVTGGGNAPEVGAVQDGYRFRGGDPADPNSWEPVR